MLGTIVNVSTILVGCTAGSTLKRGLGEKYKNTMMDAMGLVAIGIGTNTVVQAMPQSKYKVLFIVSMALGAVIGTWLDLDARFQKLVGRISGGSGLAQGLSTAILLYCFGTLSILGPIQSALRGDNTFLFTNAMLDGISSFVLSSTFGFGIALAAVVLFCWQGSIYLLAHVIEPYMTPVLMNEISIVGGLLILSSGLGILNLKQIKTMNLLPALLIPPAAIAVLGLFGL